MLILDPQVIAEVVSHLPRLMKSNKRAKDAQDQFLQMIIGFNPAKMKKSCMENLKIEREDGPGQYLSRRSLIGAADHPQEEWMKVDPGIINGQDRNLWMISSACLRNQMKASIEGQGLVIKGVPDQDQQKVRMKWMKERMKKRSKLIGQSIITLKKQVKIC